MNFEKDTEILILKAKADGFYCCQIKDILDEVERN